MCFFLAILHLLPCSLWRMFSHLTTYEVLFTIFRFLDIFYYFLSYFQSYHLYSCSYLVLIYALHYFDFCTTLGCSSANRNHCKSQYSVTMRNLFAFHLLFLASLLLSYYVYARLCAIIKGMSDFSTVHATLSFCVLVVSILHLPRHLWRYINPSSSQCFFILLFL